MKVCSTFAWLLLGLIALARPADAGWVVEWANVVRQPDGQSLPAEPSTMQIQGNRVRLTQPRSVTVIDYKKDLFTIMNPATQSFWSGQVAEYIEETARKRKAQSEKRTGRRPRLGRDGRTPSVDESKLPSVTVKRTDQTKTIAGHDTVKYEILSDGEPFQEMWVAENVDVSSDLDPDRFLAYQRKMGAGMLGQSSGRYNALYRNEDYKKLVSKGFALEIVTRHIGGGFDRTVTAIRREDIPASTFEVPESYRRVSLADVLPKPEQTAAGTAPKPVLPPGAAKKPPSDASPK